MNASQFLSLLFGHKSLEGLYLTIWDRQTHKTSTFTLPDLGGAAADAEARSVNRDVYVCTCPFVAPPESTSRGTEETAGALVATWLDVDIAGPAHKGKSRPAPSLEAAMELLSKGPVKPSIVIHSGYGLHVWWALDEPIILKTAADRVRARRVSDGWVATYDCIAKGLGFDCDKVGDLARVLRIPGTLNHKLDNVAAKNVVAIPHV